MFEKSEFDPKTREKVYRMCDVLQHVSAVDYTKERLSLYGGTGLNFLHLREIPRLSLDIDFNYRDQKVENWWKERDEIDNIVKKILSDLGYNDDDIKIQATHPLTRFTVHYETTDGQRDSIKIEMGYMRRIPIFKEDEVRCFDHPETAEEIEIKTPISEELFGNKFCTLLYRYKDDSVISSRDIFDVYNISYQTFDDGLFLDAVVIDSLMRPEPRIYEQDIEKMLDDVSIGENISRLLINRDIPEDLKERCRSFIQKYISLSKDKYKELIDTFYDEHEFKPELFASQNKLNKDISSHPAILWNLKQLKAEG